jgi:hypothetical protein
MLTKTREIGALATEGTGGEAVELETRFLLRSFWESAAGFWGKRGTRASSVLSGILLLIVVGNLVDSYGMNVWSRVIFDALEKRDSATVLELSILYSRLLAGSVFLTVLRLWARVTMQRRWREWLISASSIVGSRTAAIISSTLWVASTRTPNVVSLTMCGSRPRHRLSSPPARHQRFYRLTCARGSGFAAATVSPHRHGSPRRDLSGGGGEPKRRAGCESVGESRTRLPRRTRR